MNRLALALLAVGLGACSIDAGRGEVGVYQVASGGSGGSGGDDAAGASGSPEPVEQPDLLLTAQLRDFKKFDELDPTTNPAFANGNSEKSVVEAMLGADEKPVYRPPLMPGVTFGAMYFDQWYRDVPGTNYPVTYPLPLSLQADGTYEYDSRKSGQPDVFLGEPRLAFFPLDDGGPYATPFGNQGAPHNFAFTAELHVTFLASAGSTLQVRADDDLYVFIDRKLAIDLGGNHAAIEKLLSLDDLALTSNEPYPLDIFYAERQGATGELMLRTNVRLLPAP